MYASANIPMIRLPSVLTLVLLLAYWKYKKCGGPGVGEPGMEVTWVSCYSPQCANQAGTREDSLTNISL